MGPRRRRIISDGGLTVISRCTRALATGVVALATVLTAAPATAAVDPGPTRLVSESEQAVPGNGASHSPVLSADGRFVAFGSTASTLVPGDTNGTADVFVRDLVDGSVERVSVGESDEQLPGNSHRPAMSADGRLVLFTHSELVRTAGGSRLEYRVYLRDRERATTRVVEVHRPGGRPAGFSAGGLSGNGRFVALVSADPLVRRDDNDRIDLYRLDLDTGRVRLVSKGRTSDDYRECRWYSISHSGRFVAFEFTARLLKRDRLRARDIYVRDLRDRRPELVSVSSRGVQANRGSVAPSISAGGRYVTFSSFASNLVGRDTNAEWDVFRHDRRSGTTARVSVDDHGRQGNAQSQGAGFWGRSAGVSRDGRYVVFGSFATNLDRATDDDVRSNVFLRDLATRTTRALSLAPDGTGADADSSDVVVSPDGSAVAFASEASNLVAGDVNGAEDVFVRRLGD